MTPRLELWFSIGSTYSYLTVMRLPALAAAVGVEIVWRPFSVRTLMVEQNNIPFRDKPIKAAYMWRDIEQRAAGCGIPATLPVPYPLRHWDSVNRIAMLAAIEGWCEAYATETYCRWFQHGEEPGEPPHLDATLHAIGQNPARVLAAADSSATTDAYEAATAEARTRGLFGAPSFLVGDELFWGDDRLEDAILWAKRQAPGAVDAS